MFNLIWQTTKKRLYLAVGLIISYMCFKIHTSPQNLVDFTLTEFSRVNKFVRAFLRNKPAIIS